MAANAAKQAKDVNTRDRRWTAHAPANMANEEKKAAVM
jgi:hypothetical protein